MRKHSSSDETCLLVDSYGTLRFYARLPPLWVGKSIGRASLHTSHGFLEASDEDLWHSATYAVTTFLTSDVEAG